MTASVISLDAHRPHAVGFALCSCGHKWIAVYPDGLVDEDTLECSRCGGRTGRVVSEDEWDLAP